MNLAGGIYRHRRRYLYGRMARPAFTAGRTFRYSYTMVAVPSFLLFCQYTRQTRSVHEANKKLQNTYIAPDSTPPKLTTLALQSRAKSRNPSWSTCQSPIQTPTAASPWAAAGTPQPATHYNTVHLALFAALQFGKSPRTQFGGKLLPNRSLICLLSPVALPVLRVRDSTGLPSSNQPASAETSSATPTTRPTKVELVKQLGSAAVRTSLFPPRLLRLRGKRAIASPSSTCSNNGAPTPPHPPSACVGVPLPSPRIRPRCWGGFPTKS